ncbi:MAG: T9SS type A sorting domain-containing protein [Bacteroidota bacterium]
MKPLITFLLLLAVIIPPKAQTSFCPSDPPSNPYLADTPWPLFHRNNYAQASSCITGPLPGDSLIIKSKTNIRGGTSPWVYLSDQYPNGERVLLYSNSSFVFKFIDDGEQIITIDSLRIDFDVFTSFGWNFLLTNDKIWYTYDPKYDPAEGESTRLFKLSDEDTDDPYSDIVVLDTFDFGDYDINRVQHYTISYDGHIVFHSDNNEEESYGTVGVISQDFELLDTLRYATTADEITNHNAFPIDENNSFYVTTNKRLIRFDWNGSDLSIAWEAPYDFVNDGPTGTFAEGSGTTPTLLGWGPGNDKLVVMSDGHAKNNLLAFWRELPAGWTGRPGMDIHFADSIRIPFAETFDDAFQSIENSPTAFGYDIAIAQYNGFLGYDCENEKGVQKISWDTLNNEFNIAWANDSINMNGVLTYSEGADLVYGSGKESDCNYYYYGLDWQTGEIVLRLLLGPEGTFFDDPFYDAGNNNIIDEEGNIYFPGGNALIKLEIAERQTVSTSPAPQQANPLSLFPNPAHNYLQFKNGTIPREPLQIFDLSGKAVKGWTIEQNQINIQALQSGLYFIKVEQDGQQQLAKFVKL